MADDEITRFEKEAIQRTSAKDWQGARALFEQALASEMPDYRRVEILRNVALTYWKEDNRSEAQETARRAIELLDSTGVVDADATNLRNSLLSIEGSTSRQLPLRPFWYVVVFLAGLYWGVSVASNAPIDPKLVFLGPPFLCLITAAIAARGLNGRALLGAFTLYVNFLISFGIGYGIAHSGLIRFHYRRR